MEKTSFILKTMWLALKFVLVTHATSILSTIAELCQFSYLIKSQVSSELIVVRMILVFCFGGTLSTQSFGVSEIYGLRMILMAEED